MKTLISNLRLLGVGKLATLGAVLIAMIALLAYIMARGETANALLFDGLDSKDAAAMTAELAKKHIAFSLSPDGSVLSVPSDDRSRARLILAQAGLPGNADAGYELFDRRDALSSSSFDDAIIETRALEGELERSLNMIAGIRSSRVHLVLRHREMFSSDEQPSQASVLLTLEAHRRLSDERVRAMVNLVAAAVPGLKSQNISVIDNMGHVLASGGKISGQEDDARPKSQEREAEQHLSQVVEGLLAPALGFEQFRVATNVVMDFDRLNQTREHFDPDQQVLRSQKTHVQKKTSAKDDQNVSVSNNLPNADAGKPKLGSESTQQDETNNYEIGKTTELLVHDQPRIERQTIAVVVGYQHSVDEKGKDLWTPTPAEKLARLTDLVKGAVGYDEKRGDVVTLVSMKMHAEESASGQAQHLSREQRLLGILNDSVTRPGLAFLALISIGFFVARPLLRSADPKRSLAGETPLGAAVTPQSDAATLPAPASASTALQLIPPTPAIGNALALSASASPETVTVQGIEGEVNATSLRHAVSLVDTQPAASLSVIRNWLSEREDAS